MAAPDPVTHRIVALRPDCDATAPGGGGEPCPRCAATMIWTKASWHCLACRYKEGCC